MYVALLFIYGLCFGKLLCWSIGSSPLLLLINHTNTRYDTCMTMARRVLTCHLLYIIINNGRTTSLLFQIYLLSVVSTL